MPDVRDRRAQFVMLALVFLASVAIAAYLIRPWIAAPLAFDTAASVIHFERIASGHRLEQPLSTTPKPLLTLLYGLVYSATSDWRAISAAALAAWGLCVASAAALTWRLGGAVAALFVSVSLVLSARLLLETSWALASVWALLLWIFAGLAVTARPARWGLVGLALLLAALARLETFLVIGLALAVLAVVRFGPTRWRRPVPGAAWWVSAGLLAFPIMGLHDILLIGDPLFWTTIAGTYSAAAESAGRLPSLEAIARQLAGLALGQPAITVLAIIGAAVLAARAQWAILIGLVSLGPGMVAFLLFLAARDTFVDPRYLVPISAAMIVAAAIGVGAIRIPDLAFRPGDGPPAGGSSVSPGRAARTGGVAVAVVAIAIVASPAISLLDKSAQARIASARHMARTTDLALPHIRAALEEATAAGSRLQLFVPLPVRPRVAADLDLPLTQVGAYRDPKALVAGATKPGQLVLIDLDPSAPANTPPAYRLSAPKSVGGVRMVPLLSDPANGAWLLLVAPP